MIQLNDTSKLKDERQKPYFKEMITAKVCLIYNTYLNYGMQEKALLQRNDAGEAI